MNSPGRNMRPGEACERAPKVRRIGDDGTPPASRFEERSDRFDLGAHAAARELSLLQITLGLRQSHAVEPALVRAIEVDGDLFNCGGHHKQFGFKLACQERGNEILVDYRLKPIQTAVRILDDRDSAAAARDYDMSFGDH